MQLATEGQGCGSPGTELATGDLVGRPPGALKKYPDLPSSPF